jgi:hemoglobin/transferrin/lactoferrin receptor protein
VNGVLSDSDTSQYLGAPLGRIVGLEVAHRLDDTGLTFGGIFDAALKNSDTVAVGQASLPAYDVLNLYTEYKPGIADFLTLRLEVNNVFDETYADRATYGQEFGNVRPMYEPGRSFMLMAKAKF